MRDLKWNLARKVGGREVKVCQSWEYDKIRRNLRKIEVIVSKVELLEVRKEKEASVGRDVTLKPTTTEIEADHMTRHSITRNTVP